MAIASAPMPFPLAGPLTPRDTALLSIDCQGDFLCPGGFMDALGLDVATLRRPLSNIARLLAAFRERRFPVLHTREGYAADLSDAPPNRLWRGTDGGNPAVGDRGTLGRFLVRGEPGWEIVAEAAPRPGEIVLDKPSYGAFATTDLDRRLGAAGIRHLVLCGVTTDCCVRQTAMEALDRGYETLIVSDATAAAFASTQEALLAAVVRKGGVFGTIADTEAVVAGLSCSPRPL